MIVSVIQCSAPPSPQTWLLADESLNIEGQRKTFLFYGTQQEKHILTEQSFGWHHGNPASAAEGSPIPSLSLSMQRNEFTHLVGNLILPATLLLACSGSLALTNMVHWVVHLS